MIRVVVKLRLVPFITKTRSVKLPAPTSDPAAIAEGARRPSPGSRRSSGPSGSWA